MRDLVQNSFFVKQGHFWLVMLVSAGVLVFGCQASEAPLSPGAATFKKEVKSCLDNLVLSLLEPVARKDVAEIQAAMEKAESPAIKLCRLCPFEIGVLNPSGETLASYPGKGDGKPQNYSNYDLVIKAVKTKKIQQQQFFLQDGAKLYLVCAPLIRANGLVGLVVIAINSADAEKRWGLKEKEFLAVNFNT
jgi:hypothetical protein